MTDKMVERKTWAHFKNTGLLLLTNQFLHIFGWAIVIEIEDSGKILDCYPARVKFRGFSEDVTTMAYKNISQYMYENGEKLFDEVMRD